MGSIPLPALSVRPVAQPDVLANTTRLAQLRGLQQEEQQRAAMAPYQQQIAQQQAQSGQLQLQQQQIALKDQQAMTAAMQQWDGNKIDDLPALVIKNGGSANAVMGLKNQIIGQKQKISQMAAEDAATGASNVKTMTERNTMLSGKLSALEQVPDDQLGQAITQGAQDLVQQGLLDPQHAQMAAQLAQLPPDQARQHLETMRKGLLSTDQQLAEAQKQVAIAQEKNKSDFYAQNGGAPGVPAEIMQQADWLKKNPGKGPSDYKLWTLQHTPSAMIMGNMLSGPQNQQALDFAANNYRQTGQMPSGLYRSPGTTQAIIQRAAQLDQQEGGSGIAANKAFFSANEQSLKSLQKNYDQVQAFEGTAEKNIDLLQETAKNIPDLGARFANIPVRMLNANMLGTENMAKFKTALNTAQTEAAKVLNSSNATGVLSDSARHELQAIIDGNLTYSALVGSLNTLKQDMANRTQSYQLQIGGIQDRLRNAGRAGATVQGGNLPQDNSAPTSGGDPFAQFGGKAH